MSNLSSKFSRRTSALFIGLIVLAVIILLIYFEQIAFLYVLATVAITVLLLVVAFADLEHTGRDGDGFQPKL